MKKYKLYDLIEFEKNVLGYFDTLPELKKYAKQYYIETDSECYMVYAKLDEKINKYRFNEHKEVRIYL